MNLAADDPCLGLTCIAKSEGALARVARVMEDLPGSRVSSSSLVGGQSEVRAVVLVHEPFDPAKAAERVQAAIHRTFPESRPRIVAGFGPNAVGPDGARSSMERSAEVAAQLALHEALPPVMTFEEFVPYALLLGSPELAEEVRRGVAEFARSDEVDGTSFLPTLAAYVEAGGVVAQAAMALGVAERTFHRRIRVMNELSGRDLRRGSDRLFLDLGRRALQLRA